MPRKARPRVYKLLRNAAKRCEILNAQLDEVNHKRDLTGKGLSQIDFYRVVAWEWHYAVAVVLKNGKQYVCC